MTVKIEVDDHLVAQYENSGENMTTETHADVNQVSFFEFKCFYQTSRLRKRR